jgi:hypothetical protein
MNKESGLESRLSWLAIWYVSSFPLLTPDKQLIGCYMRSSIKVSVKAGQIFNLANLSRMNTIQQTSSFELNP